MYLEKFKVDGRIAVVTGGGQGIGLSCAEALGEAGASIVVTDRDPRMAKSACAGLKAKGYAAEAVIMDVTIGPVSQVAAELVARHGRVDILVNNAGIARSETPAETVADEHWLNVIDVNLNGTFWCCPRVRPAHAGRRHRAPSSMSARCAASSSTARRSKATTTPPRPRCII